ncbi:MAG: hypothetical protein QW360_03420 [Thermofilum sp.]
MSKRAMIERRVAKAQKEFDKAALEHPEGCVCEFCAAVLPWDARTIYDHSLRHPEMYEKKKKLSEANERRLREWREGELAKLEGRA